jgi:nitrate reductase NapD
MSNDRWHVSSAVLTVSPAAMAGVIGAIGGYENVEIHASDASHLVVTIEGRSTGQLGDTLTTLNLLDGVLGANMVFEHAEDDADITEIEP